MGICSGKVSQAPADAAVKSGRNSMRSDLSDFDDEEAPQIELEDLLNVGIFTIDAYARLQD